MRILSKLILLSQLLLGLGALAQSVDLKDIWLNYKYYDRGYDRIVWSDDDGLMFFAGEHEKGYTFIISQHSLTGEVKDTLLGTHDGLRLSFSDFQFSPDKKYILLETAIERLYRRSFKGVYLLYSIEDKSIDTIYAAAKQFNPTFSPNSKYVAFTSENNLYVYHITEKKYTQLTASGKWNELINGRCDWVYEEEFEFSKAYVWTADSKRIAFLQFDETAVKEYQMQVWDDSLYPQMHSFKYPKAGEKNSRLKLYSIDVAAKTTQLLLDEAGNDNYLARIYSTPNPQLVSVIRMNRLQNVLELLHIDVVSGQSKVVYQEKADTYVEINNEISYLDENTFLLTSEKSGYNHFYLYNFEGKQLHQLTQGDWQVDELVGIDNTNQWIYYSSTQKSPLERQVYRVSFSGEIRETIVAAEGVNHASLSETGKFLINENSTIKQPKNTTLYHSTGKSIRVLEANESVTEALQEVSIAYPQFFTFTTTDGENLNGYMIKPIHFKAKKKYPVLVYVYGGPGIQTVTNDWGSFDFMWFQTLADKGYIIVSIDGRGTGGRGADFKKQTYGKLGEKETEDVIALAKHLGTLPFIDKQRMGIWGWSFGGYLTALALTKGADYYKIGVSVAPVTNWRFYDTIYTERYLGLPGDNAKGYDENSPIHHADKLRGKLLLIHGTADDNVHFQNQMAFQKALIKANKQFNSFNYPDKNHGIYGGITRYHLYQLMTNFIVEHL